MLCVCVSVCMGVCVCIYVVGVRPTCHSMRMEDTGQMYTVILSLSFYHSF